MAPDGILVLNADDAGIVNYAKNVTREICWFSLDAADPTVSNHVKKGGKACTIEDGQIIYFEDGIKTALLDHHRIPITMDRAAVHNSSNCLGAISLAKALRVENEAIAGSYIQKFSLLSIFGSLFLFRKKNKKPILFIIILLLLMGVFFASNRMNAIILFFSLLLLLLLDKKIRLVVASSLIIFASVAAILMSNDEILKKQYHHLFYIFIKGADNVSTDTKRVEKNSEIKTLYKKINLHNSDHFQIYLTAIESWKNKPILGGGHKSFRKDCKDIVNEISEGEKKTFRPICSSHPHNYQIEVLHNTGIIGFILIVFFIFILLLKIFKKLINIKSGNKTYSMYIMPIAITMFAEIWPLKTTGSLFATWNGTAVWLIIGLSAIATTNFSEKKFDKPIKNQSSFIFKILTILFTSLIIKRLFFV